MVGAEVGNRKTVQLRGRGPLFENMFADAYLATATTFSSSEAAATTAAFTAYEIDHNGEGKRIITRSVLSRSAFV